MVRGFRCFTVGVRERLESLGSFGCLPALVDGRDLFLLGAAGFLYFCCGSGSQGCVASESLDDELDS